MHQVLKELGTMSPGTTYRIPNGFKRVLTLMTCEKHSGMCGGSVPIEVPHLLRECQVEYHRDSDEFVYLQVRSGDDELFSGLLPTISAEPHEIQGVVSEEVLWTYGV